MSCSHVATAVSPDGGESLEQTQSVQTNVNCSECAAEKKRRRAYRWKLIASIVFPAFLASIDATIIAPALPTIASEFGKLNAQLNWVVTAFTLTSTAFIPAFGQLADIFGRHSALQLSLVFMLIGSALCAGAQKWGMLLLGRALQGVSAAGISNLIEIILADNVSLEDNAKNNTIFTLISGVGFSAGPVIGGFLTQADWRWCFVLSVPVTVISHIILFFVVRKELRQGTQTSLSRDWKASIIGLSSIDTLGTILFILGTGLIILAISWGGLPYAWDSAAVLVPIVIGAIGFIGFFIYEYLFEPGRLVARAFPKQVPMIPWSLFSKKDVLLLAIINFATGAALYSAFYFISIYWNLAEGLSPKLAGIQLLYYLPGVATGVYMAIYLCNKWPGQTFYPLFAGSIIECLGIGLLAWAVTTRRRPLVNGMMALSGVGTGIRFMPASLHSAGIWPTRLAAILSLMNFAAPFGGTIATGVMGAVFTNKFSLAVAKLSGMPNENTTNMDQVTSLAGINALPEEIRNQIRQAAARAIMWSFISILPVMVLSALASVFLGNVWVLPNKKQAKERVHGSALYSSFLLAIATGTVNEKKDDVMMGATARMPQEQSEKSPEVRMDPAQPSGDRITP